jgi:mRNA interferase RelE/StbE
VAFRVLYHPAVVSEDIPRLDPTARKRLRAAIGERLTSQPHRFGKPLRATHAGLWVLRVGSYRVVYTIERDEVWVLRIGHRREVYAARPRRMPQPGV